MTKGALFRGPPAARGAFAVLTCALALGASVLPLAAQESRSLQDMLLAAIRQNDLPAVRSLVASGADVAKRNAKGKTAIDVAVDLGRFEIAELLVSERRRQREAQLAAARIPAPTAPPVEVVQPSAEAPPVVASAPSPEPATAQPQTVAVSPAPAAAPPAPVAAVAPTPAPIVSAPTIPVGAVTPEQLVALAQQLLQAAQMLAAAQNRIAAALPTIAAQPSIAPPPKVAVAPPPSAPVEVAVARTVEPFMPKPGRKPIVEAPEPDPIVAAVPRESIVVTPRRRSLESAADRLRDSLESEVELPVVNVPARPASPTPAVQLRPAAPKPLPPVQPATLPIAPDAEAEDEEATEVEGEPQQPQSDVMNAIKGIGSFFGFGSEAKRAAPASSGSRELRDQFRGPEPRRRNVPHVPAKRANEIRADAGSSAAARSASAGTTHAAPPHLTPRAANPFDPGVLPQGAVLPYADPVAGSAPEFVRLERPEMEAKPAAKPEPRPAPRALPKPEVPPLAEVQAKRDATPAPTSAFERRPLPRAVQPPEKEDVGVIQSLATAMGIADPDDSGADNSGAGEPDKITSKAMPLLNLRPPLADVRLMLGNSVTTEQRLLPRGLAEPDPCIRRSGGKVMFCIVPVDWPAPVDAAFSLTTYLYQGTRAIARYDGGKATHFHALFASQHYRDVVAYFTNRFGPPTDEWKRTIAPFDQPRQPNPTMVWRARDSRTNQVTILEVRKYDDTRNVFPDMEHGAVRLYKSGADRVFPVITGLDIMGIDWAARSDHTDGTDTRALANTIRMRR